MERCLLERIFCMLRVSTLFVIVMLAAGSTCPVPVEGAAPQETTQEKKKVPKDSIELTVIGCLTGRVLKTLDQRRSDVESSPYVGERTFRLSSKKDVTEQIKKEQHHLVEVTGIVKRSDLDSRGIKAGPIAINGGKPVASTRGIPSPAEDVAVMDVSSLRRRSSSCTPE
jgi:hypothetical protein